jgi:hypothetical protein
MKEQYITDIRADQNIFPYQDDALSRIKQIYRTARIVSMENHSAINLKAYLVLIYANLGDIPSTLENYNSFAKKHIKEVASLISHDNNLRFGVAQKIFNLFMKDLWAWNKLNIEQESVLHFPIERTILSLFKYSPWRAWTRVYSTNDDYENTFEEYLDIQSIFRNQLQYYIFTTPLELDQYLWHKFD